MVVYDQRQREKYEWNYLLDVKTLGPKSAFFLSRFWVRQISKCFPAELLLKKLFQSKAGASKLKYPTSSRQIFISGRYPMGFGGKSTGRATKASLWTPALAGSQTMFGQSCLQRASRSLSAPLVVGKHRPQEKRYLNSTNLRVNCIQSYWCRKILWPWNSKLQNQSIFLKQGRFLADSTNIYGFARLFRRFRCWVPLLQQVSAGMWGHGRSRMGMGEKEGRSFQGREDASTSLVQTLLQNRGCYFIEVL